MLLHCRSGFQDSNIMQTYYYLDGSANQYTITSTQIVYDPVPPEESSTGMYSGGEPFQIKIDSNQFNMLKLIFEKSINNKTGQGTMRNKGPGMLIIKPENRTYIFEMNSIQKKEIEEAIASASEK